MHIRGVEWNKFSTYLFFDAKLKKTAPNVSSLKHRYYTLYTYFKNKHLNRITFSKFIEEQINSGKSVHYANNLIKVVKHIERYLYNGKLKEFEGYKFFKFTRKHYQILEPHEIQKIATYEFSYVREKENRNDVFKAFYLLLGCTGMRVGEALSIKWTDISKDPIPHILLKDTKSNEERAVPIGDELITLIEALPNVSEYVFTAGRGSRHLSYETLKQDLSARARKLNMGKRIFAHLFRHSYITTMLTDGDIDALNLARIVGHKDTNTTQWYNQSSLVSLHRMASTHPLLRKTQSIETLKKLILVYANKIMDLSSIDFKFDIKRK